MTIQPFIFNWRGQYANTLRTTAQLLDVFNHVTIINSDETHADDDWINIGEQAYFGQQFAEAIERFDGDILFHIQADANYHDWKTVVDHALATQSQYQWGVYAPDVDFTLHTGAEVNIQPLDNDATHLQFVTCTDCTCWFIHRSVIEELKRQGIRIEVSNYGWGIDFLICALSYQLGRPVIRDYRHVIQHPKGTGYNTKLARQQMLSFYQGLPADTRQIIQALQQRLGFFEKR